MKIAVFLDSRPGHRKQTLGVLDALKELTALHTIDIPVPHLSLAAEVMNWLRYFVVPRTGCAADLSGCDFMIGTGSRTHIPMLACRAKFRMPVIACMAPAALLRGRFDLCIVPRHDGIPAAGNIFHTDGPPNRSRSKSLHDRNRGLILVGGRDEKSHRWNDAAIIDAVAGLLQDEKNMSWTVSSSPRTPEKTNAGLEDLAAGCTNASFVRFSDTGPGWIENEYDRDMTVWVTADSISMIFEALSAGCRVGVLPVLWKKKNNKFQRCIDDLCTRGLLVSYAAWREGQADWSVNPPLNEAQRCAREILKRWWPDRLQ